MGRPTVGRCWSFLPEELAVLLSPSLPALGQNIFLLVSNRAAFSELCCHRIRGPIGRCGKICLRFVATKPNGTGSNYQDDEHHGRRVREPFEFFRDHQ